jgi:hypothetical protein
LRIRIATIPSNRLEISCADGTDWARNDVISHKKGLVTCIMLRIRIASIPSNRLLGIVAIRILNRNKALEFLQLIQVQLSA